MIESPSTIYEAKQESINFSVEDRSLLAPLLKNLITIRVLKFIPDTYSANALTLSGAACAAGVAILMWISATEMRAASTLGAITLCASAFLLLTYAVFDQLDGMQARRLGTSGHLGDFVDHWVDTAIANLVPVPIMLMLGVEPLFILIMHLAAAFAFWSANWETRNLNKRILPKVGGLESIVIGCVMMVITAFNGVGIWDISFANVKLLSVIYWSCLPWLLLVIFFAVRSGRSSLLDLLGFAITLTPLSIWLLLDSSQPSQVGLYSLLGYVSLGLVATIMTGDLMRQYKIKISYQRIKWVFFVIGLVLLFVSNYREDANFATVEKIILIGQAIIGVGWVVWQGMDTFKQLQPETE
jgi:phosphatidylglycerophosphate synthase